MSHHRRRPPIRLRRQWERERAEWWRAWNAEHPPWTSNTRFRRVDTICAFPFFDPATGQQMIVSSVKGIDADGNEAIETSPALHLPRCPVRTFPRR